MEKYTNETIKTAECPTCHSKDIAWDDDLVIYCTECGGNIGVVGADVSRTYTPEEEGGGKKYDAEKPEALFPISVFVRLFQDDYVSPYKSAMKSVVLSVTQSPSVGWEYVAISAAEEVLQHGKKKYGANNWQKLDNFVERYHAALIRHTAGVFHDNVPSASPTALLETDSDSGIYHWKHVVCNCVFLMWKIIKEQRSFASIV